MIKDYRYSLRIMKQELENKYICPEIRYAFKASIEAIERNIPIKIKQNKYNVYFCPVCKNSAWQIRDQSKFCFRCGQKLDWR